MLRIAKILLILAVAAWGYIAAAHNILDWEGTLGAVTSVTSMTTFEGGADSWQAIENPILSLLGGLFIASSKLLAALLCTLGAFRMIGVRNGSAMQFDQAKRAALAGCAVAVFMLFGGFIVIAETFFELWRSDAMRGPVLDSAFRYAGLIGLIGVFVGMREE